MGANTENLEGPSTGLAWVTLAASTCGLLLVCVWALFNQDQILNLSGSQSAPAVNNELVAQNQQISAPDKQQQEQQLVEKKEIVRQERKVPTAQNTQSESVDEDDQLALQVEEGKASALTTTDAAARQLEQERLATDKSEEVMAAQQAELERLADLEAEEQRLAVQKAQEELAAQEAEEERLAARKAEAEQLAAKKVEEELAAQKAEEERLAAIKAEAEQLAAKKAEEELAAQKAEEERLAAIKAEAEQLAAQKAEAELAALKAEEERLAALKAEEEKVAAVILAAARAEEARLAAVNAEIERLAAEQETAAQKQDEAEAAATPLAEEQQLAALASQGVNPSAAETAFERVRREELASIPGLSARVRFENTDIVLRDSAKQPMDRLFELLFLYSETSVTVQVSSNEFELDNNNKLISRERALTLVNYLIDRGLDEERFRIRALGKQRLPFDSHRVTVFATVIDK